jgi:hypothetical protein
MGEVRMTAEATKPQDARTGEASARNGSERLLIFIVALLGLLIVAALGAVLFKIVYLASPPADPSVRASSADAVGAAADRVVLPPGAVVKSVSLAGDRLAVHYEAADGTGVAVVDLGTGAVVRRLTIAPSSP